MLTSRERCVRSMLLEEPDRIPLFLNIRPEPYEKLMATLGISEKGMSPVKIEELYGDKLCFDGTMEYRALCPSAIRKT